MFLFQFSRCLNHHFLLCFVLILFSLGNTYSDSKSDIKVIIPCIQDPIKALKKSSSVTFCFLEQDAFTIFPSIFFSLISLYLFYFLKQA